MVCWQELIGTKAIGSSPIRRRTAPLAREGEDAEMGGIPIRIGRQRASGLSPHILCSAFASYFRLVDAVADRTLLLASAVARTADSEDNTMREEMCRGTSSVGVCPTPNEDDNMQQPVLSRTNGPVRPDPPLPTSSSPPLPLPPPQQQLPSLLAAVIFATAAAIAIVVAVSAASIIVQPSSQ